MTSATAPSTLPPALPKVRRALAISQGDYSVFVTRPISATLLACAVAVLIVPMLLGRRDGVAAS